MKSRWTAAIFLLLVFLAMFALPRVSSQTPLMRALENHHQNEVGRLIEQGDVGDVNAVDSFGVSTLMYAMKYATSEGVQQLLDYSIHTNVLVDVNYVNQRFGYSTLMYAISYATSEGMQQLLDYSIQTNQLIDVNYVNQRTGRSTLMWAIMFATSERIQQLMDYSIQTNQRIDVYYVNPRNERTTFEVALRRAGYSSKEARKIIRSLLQYPSFFMNHPLNKKGETALMLVLSVGKGGLAAGVVQEMLKLPGLSLNKRNYNGKTIEQYALESHHDEIKRLVKAATFSWENTLD